MRRTIEDLRNALFDTIEALQREKNPMDIDRAKAIADAAQVIINSAKVEVEYLKVKSGAGTGFIPSPSGPRLVPGKAQSGSE